MHVFVRNVRTGLASAALLALSLALCGCFDFEQDLVLRGSGAGTLEVKLRMDPAFKGALQDVTILGEQKTPVVISKSVKDGQYVQDEKVSFNSLDELRLQSETLAIVNNGATLFGIGPKKLSLTREVENDGADPASSDIMRGLFQDRSYTFSVTLPGWILKAYPIDIGGQSIAPHIAGGTISWQIPMAEALSAKRLVYRVDFLAYMNIAGNMTAERVQGHLKSLEPTVDSN